MVRKPKASPYAGNQFVQGTWQPTAALGLLTLLLFLPSLGNGLVNFDDEQYILGNPFTADMTWGSIRNMFSGYFHGHYHPLTLLSLAIDRSLFGNAPAAIHAHSVLLHVLNVVLVHQLFRQWTDNSTAFFAALVVAVHPLAVESVSWASERKNVLFTTWGLAMLHGYTRVLRGGSFSAMIFTIVAFIIALLAKSQAITLVLGLLAVDVLLDVRPWSQRGSALKVIMVGLSVAFALVGAKAQQEWGHDPPDHTSLERAVLSLGAIGRYAVMVAIPWGTLSAYHPFPADLAAGMGFSEWLFWPIVALVVAIGIPMAYRKDKVAFAGLLFFVLTLLPMLKFLDIPYGRYLMADRYAYVPLIGASLVVVRAWEWCRQRWSAAPWALIGVAFISLWAFQTIQRQGIWRSSITLWSDVIDSYPTYAHPYIMRGVAHASQKQWGPGMKDMEQAAILAPDLPTPHRDMAKIYEAMGDYVPAIAAMDRALALDPDGIAENWAYRGELHMRVKNKPAGSVDLNRAIAIEPSAAMYIRKGYALMIVRDQAGSEQALDQAIALGDRTGQAAYLLAGWRLQSGNRTEACRLLSSAKRYGWREAFRLSAQQCQGLN